MMLLPTVAAAGAGELPLVLVEGTFPGDLNLELDEDSLAFGRVTESDTAALVPGANVAKGGALSGLPMLHGLGDDRVRTLVDGVPVTSACPMHMNPPLSYVDPSRVQSVTVLPGVTPVSLGGDSVGGTISVTSASPVFAADTAALRQSGAVSSI